MRSFTKLWLLPALLVLAGMISGTAFAQRTVTLQLNTATLPDTLDAADIIQVRGAIGGTAPFTLPDGNVIAWDDATQLTATNVEGDYWTISFQIPDDQELQYKFFSPLAQEHQIDGWESGDNHVLEAGTGDVELPLHFFARQSDLEYDWRPWEEKEDSVAVWFRVFMNTVNAVEKGYDPEAEGLVIGLRGDPALGGTGAGGEMIDWGGVVPLSRESDDPNHPGYHLWSGVMYLPETAVGETQNYKFYMDGLNLGDGGYEDGNNRTFVVPETDTTLHWVYFSNSTPVEGGAQLVTANVIFTVDITPLEDVGVFSRVRGDTMIVRGGFNGWGNCLQDASANPDDCMLFEGVEATQFSNTIPVTAFANNVVSYKFYVDFQTEEGHPLSGDAGYEEPLDFGGGNRTFVFTGVDDQDLGIQYFNSIRPGNVLTADDEVEVTFQVDMTPALTFTTKEVFDPATDSVRVNFEDGIWRYTQQLAHDVETLEPVVLEDPDGDMIYTGTYLLKGPTYNALPYRYEYGNSVDGYIQEGSGGFDPGRRRYQYVLPNQDGSWPAAYTLPLVQIVESGAVPFECNPTAENLPQNILDLCYEAGTSPTGIEVVDSELPKSISLSQNYPNPFNPSTTFEYTITQTQHVKVRVFDLMGRLVATLVDGVQPASTYRVTFDASHLSSGLYLYQLQTPTQTITKRMILVK